MQRIIALAIIGLVLVSCDPVKKISASGRISAPLERTCVVETLGMERTVRMAGPFDDVRIYAELIIPQALKGPSYPKVIVEERRTEKGELEISFSINFVPDHGSLEYQAYVQKTIEELRDRTIERCAR